MRSTRVVVTVCLCFLVALGLEFWAYPWAIYFGNFTYGFGITLVSYLVTALLVSSVAAAATFFLSHYRSMPAIGQALMTATSMLVTLCALALIFGPFGLDVPLTRVRGIFFSEWNFMTFSSEVSAPTAVLAGLIAWAIVRRQRRTPHTAML